MNGAFYIGATGLRSEQQALDVIANNIANVNTGGFKRTQVQFSELMSSAPQTGGLSATNDVSNALAGVMVQGSSPVFTQGKLTPTGQALDLAINGDGFIELMGAGGQDMLWRGGTLKVNADGYLAASNDMPLKGMISVPTGTTAITIDAGGQVRAQTSSSTATTIGQIDLVMPKDVSQLQASYAGLYTAPSGARLISTLPGQDGAGTLVQGSLESSNVELSDEMVNMLLVQRAFAANAQVVQAGDQLMGIANGLKR